MQTKEFGDDDLRFMYRQMRRAHLREQNRKRATLLVLFGLGITIVMAILVKVCG